jgi:membrane-associated PAP2 superfamily phosphatase
MMRGAPMSFVHAHVRPDPGRFFLLHVLLIPGGLVLVALVARYCGLDALITTAFFDPISGTFPARTSSALETLGHRFAKSAVLALWLTLLAAALAAPFLGRLACHRATLWTAAAAMALGPTVVATLKNVNAYHCPWDLKQYGGYADLVQDWFVSAADIGRCFPGGHAAGGFCLVAIAFAGLASGDRRLSLIGLVSALVAGSAFSAVRIVQGAHFLSHNLFSAAIDWCACALCFLPLFIAGNKRQSPRAWS